MPTKKNPKKSRTADISTAKRDPSAAAEIRHPPPPPPPPESMALTESVVLSLSVAKLAEIVWSVAMLPNV